MDKKQRDREALEAIRQRYLNGEDGFQVMFDLEDLNIARPMAAMLIRMWNDDKIAAEENDHETQQDQ